MRQLAFQVHNLVKESEAKVVKVVKKFMYASAWTLPMLLMLPILTNIRLDRISACQKCVILIDVPVLICKRISWVYGYTVLAMALTISTIAIVIIYCLSLRLYWNAVPGFRTDHERRQFSNMQSRVTLYMIVFIVCWAPSAMISFHKWIGHSASSGHVDGVVDVNRFFWLYAYQSAFAPVQGLLNSIVYGWSRKHFRRSPLIYNAPLVVDEDAFKTPYVDFSTSVSLSDDDECFRNNSIVSYDSVR